MAIPLLPIGNADYADMPSEWTDPVQEKYKGQYQLHGLGGGTGKTVYASIVSRYKDPEVGEPFVVESLAIVKGTDKYDLCVEFCNWLGDCREGL